MKSCLVLLAFVFFIQVANTAQDDPMAEVRQLIVVTSEDWHAVPGQLRRYERANETSRWREVGKMFPIVVGRNGMGWGRGLLPGQNVKGPVKKEGDGKSPAGIFRLSSAFGWAKPEKTAWIKLPYQHLSFAIECVDDVKSAYYNSIVDRKRLVRTDWNSSEKMRRMGEPYRWGIFVDHNVTPVEAGKGSCIFLHVWHNDRTGTSGCTAMSRTNMEEILHWLDATRKPMLVQAPKTELKRKEWGLPE